MYHSHRLRRWTCRGCLALTALVLLVAPVSHAQVSLDQITKTDLAADAQKKPGPGPGPKSVPERDTTSLLLLGLGVTSLVASGVNRRKRIASVVAQPRGPPAPTHPQRPSRDLSRAPVTLGPRCRAAARGATDGR